MTASNGAVPLPGPFDTEPDVDPAAAHPMLLAAVDGLPVGAWDRLMIDAHAEADPKVTAWLASMLRRAFTAGLDAGRAEAADEMPSVKLLAREVSRLTPALISAQDTIERQAQEIRDLKVRLAGGDR
jgi:hypothetical protein